MHAAAARDPILSTQRIRKVKISMVGIYKVKVRLAYLALAHVSHFFSEREPWALKQSTRFAVFVISENHLRQLCTCLWPPRRSLFSFSTHSQHFLYFLLRSFHAFKTVLQPASKWTCRSKPQLGLRGRCPTSPLEKSRNTFRLGPPRPY